MARHKIEINKPCPTCGQHVSAGLARERKRDCLMQEWATAADRARVAAGATMSVLDDCTNLEGAALREGMRLLEACQRHQERCRRAEARAWKALERHYSHKLLPEELA